MRRSLTTPDRRQTPPPLAVVRQRKTPAAPRYTVSASGSPVRNENLLLQLKFCSLQSPMHYLSCEKSGLELFLDEVLQRVVLMRELRVHPLVLAELALQLLQAFQLRRIKPPVLRLPVVVGRRANPVLAPDFLHRHAGIGFPQNRDDLRLRESRLLHQNLLVVVCQKVLLSKCPEEGEAYGTY